MNTKASITGGERHHLYVHESPGEEPTTVFLEIQSATSFSITKETTPNGTTENLEVEIPADAMDDIAIAWMKKRKLQGAVGGPVGNEFGSPDCPWE